MQYALRHHDFSYGHRVYGHESKCAHLHGHNGRVNFMVGARELDKVGRVLDFSVIKSLLCDWVEREWDHRFLVWDKDPAATPLYELDPIGTVFVDFNPTAENMAAHLLWKVGPEVLEGTGVTLIQVEVQETRKCSAIVDIVKS